MPDQYSRRDMLELAEHLKQNMADIKQVLKSVDIERVVRLEETSTDMATDVAEIKGLLREQNSAVRTNQQTLAKYGERLEYACETAEKADSRSHSNEKAIGELSKGMSTWVKLTAGTLVFTIIAAAIVGVLIQRGGL